MAGAVIGGTGFHEGIAGVTREVDTPYGPVQLWHDHTTQLWFVPRHGPGHRVPPHRVNYRAFIWALWQLEVQWILATAAVGSLRRELPPGRVVLVDQFIDWTRCRPHTFYDRDTVVHTDFTAPYCPTLRRLLGRQLAARGLDFVPEGCYVCTEGPRYETPAEVRALSAWGGDVVGMTNVPEVVLAREAGLCYALVAVVTNYGAGLSPGRLDHREVVELMSRVRPELTAAVTATLCEVPPGCVCPPRAQNL
ncbi:MAG TPA: 5'-methylthioadenosine phosphorylase [Clostridiales bacterium UBA8153]|nr:5'-methylthioadenosine phosphorylase [Clostridiales bacterium UBA8153]